MPLASNNHIHIIVTLHIKHGFHIIMPQYYKIIYMGRYYHEQYHISGHEDCQVSPTTKSPFSGINAHCEIYNCKSNSVSKSYV